MGKKIFKEQIKKLSNGVNAIIHFDYFLGDTIAIEKLKSSIIINNKGELLFPQKDFGKRSEARNRLLADLLSRTDFMEKAGTGIQRVKDDCRNNGNKVSFDFTDSFWVTIKTNENREVTDKVTDNLTKNQMEIINLIRKNSRITTNELSIAINISQRKIKENIRKLKEKGIIKRIGNTKSGHWVVLDNKEVEQSP